MFKRVFVVASQFLAVFFIISCVGSGSNSTFLVSNSKNIKLETTDDLYQFFTHSAESFPLISAHRGGPTLGYPENAIETFAYRANTQPIIIECDLRLSKDSVIVLMHDERLERTSNGKGKLSQYTFKELQQFRLKDTEGNLTNFKIPSLDQALKWGKGIVVFTLDVKRGVPYVEVVKAIQRNNAQAYSVIITYQVDEVAEVHRLDPDLMISAAIKSSNDLLRISDKNIPDNRLIAFIGSSEASQKHYKLLHEHGIMCILGTMGNLDRRAIANGDQVYAEFIERGADILSTDRPEEAGKALTYYRNKRGIRSPYIK